MHIIHLFLSTIFLCNKYFLFIKGCSYFGITNQYFNRVLTNLFYDVFGVMNENMYCSLTVDYFSNVKVCLH